MAYMINYMINYMIHKRFIMNNKIYDNMFYNKFVNDLNYDNIGGIIGFKLMLDINLDDMKLMNRNTNNHLKHDI